MNCIELKVVFIVPTVYLVTQQKAMFEKYLPYKTMAVSGDASSAQVCLIGHLRGSSIATNSLRGVYFLFVTIIVPCIFFFCNDIPWIIDYHGYM